MTLFKGSQLPILLLRISILSAGLPAPWSTRLPAPESGPAPLVHHPAISNQHFMMAFEIIARRLGLSIGLITAIGLPVSAQDSAAAAAERKVTSGVFSARQAERGEASYRTSCQSCHAKTEYTGD